jgi:hypothetical protein
VTSNIGYFLEADVLLGGPFLFNWIRKCVVFLTCSCLRLKFMYSLVESVAL